MDPFAGKLSEYLDGSLSSREREDVASHLVVCSECRDTLADLKRVEEAARSLAPLAPPPAVWNRIVARIERRTAAPAAPSAWPSLLPVAAMLVVAAAVAG